MTTKTSDTFGVPLRAPHGAVAVIMAGGSGTRFWPYSRASFPKQYLPLAHDGRTLIRATVDRILSLTGDSGVVVVTAGSQQPLVAAQVPEASVLVEPTARNTAACLALAAVKVLCEVGDAPMICLPADHLIEGEDEIRDVYSRAVKLAGSQDVIVTIGVKPTYPETGYGYIEAGARKDGAAQVTRFIEKPTREVAGRYVAEGRYYWNSGMFVMKPSVLLAAIRSFVPEIALGMDKIAAAWGTAECSSFLAHVYSTLPSVSVDVGVMERARNVVMIPGESFGWSDVGSWSSWLDVVSSLGGGDQSNVGVHADALFVDCERVAVVGHHERQSKRLIAAVGVQDLVVVETEDAILICHRDRTQEVKRVVETLRSEGKDQLL